MRLLEKSVFFRSFAPNYSIGYNTLLEWGLAIKKLLKYKALHVFAKDISNTINKLRISML